MSVLHPPPSTAAPVLWAEFYRTAALAHLLAGRGPDRPGPRPTAFAEVHAAAVEYRVLHQLLRARAIIAGAEDVLPGIVGRVDAEASRLAAEDGFALDTPGWTDGPPDDNEDDTDDEDDADPLDSEWPLAPDSTPDAQHPAYGGPS